MTTITWGTVNSSLQTAIPDTTVTVPGTDYQIKSNMQTFTQIQLLPSGLTFEQSYGNPSWVANKIMGDSRLKPHMKINYVEIDYVKSSIYNGFEYSVAYQNYQVTIQWTDIGEITIAAAIAIVIIILVVFAVIYFVWQTIVFESSIKKVFGDWGLAVAAGLLLLLIFVGVMFATGVGFKGKHGKTSVAIGK